MSLKDRVKNQQEQIENQPEAEISTFNISFTKVLSLIKTVENPEKLGLIVKEVAKFLETFATEDISLSVTGKLDCGKNALLTCLLSSVLSENTEIEECEEEIQYFDTDAPVEELQNSSTPEIEEEDPVEPPPMVKKRKTLREKLKGG